MRSTSSCEIQQRGQLIKRSWDASSASRKACQASWVVELSCTLGLRLDDVRCAFVKKPASTGRDGFGMGLVEKRDLGLAAGRRCGATATRRRDKPAGHRGIR